MMQAIKAVVFLVSCGLLPWWIAGPSASRGWQWPVRLAVGIVVFYAAMLLPGVLGIVVGKGLVSLGTAATTAATLAIALGLALRAGFLQRELVQDVTAEPLRLVPALSLVGVISTATILTGLLLFEFPRGYEPRAYHLPIAINIARSGSIEPWDLAFMHMYPGNQSLLGAFLFSWLPERAISPANIASLALCAIAVYALSRRVGADRNAAMLVAAGVCTIPIFGFSALEFGADVAGAAMLAIAAYLVFEGDRQRPLQVALAGLVAGLAYGFKSLHLVPVAMFGVLILLQLSGKARGCSDATTRVVNTTVFGLAFLVTAGPWLLRNYLAAGNPLYPVHISPVFDWLGWPAAPDFSLAQRGDNQLEWVESSGQWLVYPWVEGHYIGQNYKHSSGLGAFFAAAIAPALLVGIGGAVSTVRNSSRATHEAIARASLTGVALCIVFAWWLLGDRQPRYFMGAIVLVAPIAAYLLTELRGARRKILELLWLACILMMLVLIGAKIGSEVGGRLLQSRDVVRHEALEYVAEVDRLPPSSVVLNCVRRPMNYALFGERLANRVISYSTARARFSAGDGERWRFTAGALIELGVTHIYLDSNLSWTADEDVRLVPIGRLDRNAYNDAALPAVFTLYRVDSLRGIPILPQ